MPNSIDERGWPLPPQPWLYSDRMLRALSDAAQIHVTHVRKRLPAPAPLVGYVVTVSTAVPAAALT